EVEDEFGCRTAERRHVPRSVRSAVTSGTAKLEPVGADAPRRTASAEAGHPPAERLEVGDRRAGIATVGAARVLVVDEVFQPVEDTANPRETPGNQRCAGTQTGDHRGEPFGFLHRALGVGRAVEMLPEHQVGGEVGRGPALAQRGCVCTELEQQIAELQAFTDVDRCAHRDGSAYLLDELWPPGVQLKKRLRLPTPAMRRTASSMTAPTNAMMISAMIERLVMAVVTPRYRARRPPASAPMIPITMSVTIPLPRPVITLLARKPATRPINAQTRMEPGSNVTDTSASIVRTPSSAFAG